MMNDDLSRPSCHDAMRRHRRAVRKPLAALLTVATLLLGGCSSGSDGNPDWAKRVPVSGTVLYKGEPIEGAIVTFTNAQANAAATGTTDASGKFALTTYTDKDGAVPGAQVVTIRRVDVIDKTPEDVDVSAGGAALPPEIKWIVPEKYSLPNKSGLTADVTESGPNEFTFDLK